MKRQSLKAKAVSQKEASPLDNGLGHLGHVREKQLLVEER
jgi:hypothetical protein